MEFLRFLILEIDPRFRGFEQTLWTRAMVGELIERVFGVSLSVESVGRIMRERVGLSPRRPVRRAAEAVKAFVEANRERLELYFLPPCSPQLNPDEPVWNHLKNHTVGKRGFRIAELMQRLVEAHMSWLSEAKGLIRSFFAERHCRCITAP